MNAVFVDTSYLLALELANDGNHTRAVQHWRGASSSTERMVTTSYVVDEVVTFFNHRGFHAKAVRVGNSLLRSPSVHLVHVDEALFFEGWAEFQKYYDKNFSLTDCISFVVMRQMTTHRAMAFDKHFEQAGFTTEP